MYSNKICVLLLLFVPAGAAQSFRPLRGEIRAPLGTDLSYLTVRLDRPGTPDRGETAAVSVGGDFMFTDVPEGIYTLRLLNSSGNEILSEPLTVGAANPPISVQLPESAGPRPSGETVSIARLRHRPNRHALEAARKAQEFSRAGASERAAAQWKKAVELDPEFSEAHGNLGVQYARLDRPADAIEEFRKAVALDPYTPHHQSNLAVALAQSGRLDEAETWARRAVRLEPANPGGHYVLGCVLAARSSTIAEGIHELRIAAARIPRVHRFLAEIYHAQGNEALAAAERKQLLDAGTSGDTPAVEHP
ncbi:MAG TPA: tetratricopeptide repeat protein [Bryobacteraceae bacterium]|nr:tetratricopeptide repeat protein [Bryobacteraceae bacterium]